MKKVTYLFIIMILFFSFANTSFGQINLRLISQKFSNDKSELIEAQNNSISIGKDKKDVKFMKKLKITEDQKKRYGLEAFFNTFYSAPSITSIAGENFVTSGDINTNLSFGGGIMFHWRTGKDSPVSLKLGVAYNGTSFEFTGPGIDKNQDNTIDTVPTKTKLTTGSDDVSGIISFDITPRFSVEVGGTGSFKSINDILKIINLISNTDTQAKLEDFNTFSGQLHLGFKYAVKLKGRYDLTIGGTADIGASNEGKTSFIDKIKNSKFGINVGLMLGWGDF